jgi:hypothetical protein
MVNTKFGVCLQLRFAVFQMPFSSSSKDITWNFDASINRLVDIMPITFNVMLLGVLCGSVGRF